MKSFSTYFLILRYTSLHHHLLRVRIEHFFQGSNGSSINQLYGPRTVTEDVSTGILYVAGTSNYLIVTYDPGSTVTVVVVSWNGAGALTTQLNMPSGVYFDSSLNSLLIVNIGAHNIVRWIVNPSRRTLVGGFLGACGSITMSLVHNFFALMRRMKL